MESYIVSLVIFAAVFAVFGLGLNLQWGFTGLLNFGHVAFMTLGAYTTALLSLWEVPWLPTPVQIILAVMAGAILSAVLGLLIGVSTLRLREDYLAIVTIGVSEIIRLIALNEEWLTRGSFGIQRFPLPLANLEPNGVIRWGMIGIFLAVMLLGYWRWGVWLQRQLRKAPLAELLKTLPLLLSYFVTLAGVLTAIALGARQAKIAELPAWGIGIGLILALVAVGWLYTWLSHRFLAPLEHLGSGLTLIFSVLLAGASLWTLRYACSALYNYAENPTKTGLMWISVLMVAILFWAVETLVRSPWGRVLKAIREDDQVAKALGKNVFWYKLQSFMLGGLIAGIAGALYAWQLTVVYPDNFRPLITFNAWIMVVLGGSGHNAGTLLGAAIFWIYQDLTRFLLPEIVPLDSARLGAFRVMVIGFLLMALMVWRPQGILGKKEELSLGR